MFPQFLLRKIKSNSFLSIQDYYRLDGWQGIAKLANAIELQSVENSNATDNQPFVVAHTCQLLHQEKYDEAEVFLNRAIAARQSDFVYDQLYFEVRQLKRNDIEREKCKLEDKICTLPFTDLIVKNKFNGMGFCCFMRHANINGLNGDADAAAAWFSPRAEMIRKTVLDGTFLYCSKRECPHIDKGTLPKRSEIDPALYRNYTKGPTKIALSFDDTCNLKCLMCRDQLIVNPEAEQDKYINILEKKLFPLMHNAKHFHANGRGDIYSSKSIKYALNLMKKVPDVQEFAFTTNAVLFNPEKFINSPEFHGKSFFIVSIDAATEDTYLAIRRGGNFKRLMDNLKSIALFREQGLVKKFFIAFVIQKLNYREMPAFVRMGNNLGVDRIRFSTMNNPSGFIPEDVFAQQRVWAPSHPDYEDFLKCLADPIMNSSKVALEGLEYLRRSGGGYCCE